MENPFSQFDPSKADQLIDELERLFPGDAFLAALHAAAVVCGLAPNTEQAADLVRMVGEYADATS